MKHIHPQACRKDKIHPLLIDDRQHHDCRQHRPSREINDDVQ
ncbi:MAG: hypothetical protein WCR45_02000 [Bacteroidaceae bacterium]